AGRVGLRPPAGRVRRDPRTRFVRGAAMPDAVVDIGNSRVKFCRVTNGKLELPVRGLPAEDLASWDGLATEWGDAPGRTWAVASTNPDRLQQFVAWVQSRGERAVAIDAP